MPFEDWPANQNQTSSTVPTTAPTAAVSATSIPTAGNTNTTVLLQAKNCAMFPATAIVAGFFPGLVIGALLVYLASLCWARRKQNRNSTFRRMPDMEVTSTQNVHPNHKRFKSNTTSKSSKTMQDMVMIGFDPNDATSKHSDRKVDLTDSEHPNSTSGNVDGGETAEVKRRGRLRVHGETPQLPSVHTFLPLDHNPLTQLNSPTAATRHARKTSNPSYDDITSKRLQFHQHPSEDCLRESALEDRTHDGRVHSTSTESVGSSHHSSVHGRRYPIAVPDHMNKTHSNQHPPTLHIQTSIPQAKPNITTTNSNTTIIDDSEVDVTPSTATQSPYPPHHHNQYPSPEAPMPPSAGYRAGRLTTTTDRSESMYPSSFLDLHFSTTPQLSNSTPHMNYSHQAYPPLPQIPPLFSSPVEQLYPNQFLQQPNHDTSPTADMISPIAIARIGPPPPHTLSTSNTSHAASPSSSPPHLPSSAPSASNNYTTQPHLIPTRTDSNGSCEMIVGIELDGRSINHGNINHSSNNNNTVIPRGMVPGNGGHVREGSMCSNMTTGGRYQHLGAPLRSGTMNGGRYSKQSFQSNRIRCGFCSPSRIE